MNPQESDQRRLGRVKAAWQSHAPSSSEIVAARQRLAESRGLAAARLRRIARLWQATAATPREIQAARHRLGARPEESRLRGWGRDVAYGLCAGVVLLLAFQLGPEESVQKATPVTLQSAPSVAAPSAAPRPQPEPALANAGQPKARLVVDGREFAVAPGVEYDVPLGSVAVVWLGQERREVRGPDHLEFTVSPDRAGALVLRVASEGASSASPSPRRTPAVRVETSTGASWQVVAQALRNGDHAAAEQQLRTLSAASGAKTRDAARLALAQLLLSSGRGGEARSLLQTLVSGATSEAIQRRAKELLEGRPTAR